MDTNTAKKTAHFNIPSVSKMIQTRGYSAASAKEGIAYAIEREAYGTEEALSLAMSRILYTDDQLADGALFR